jgi:hypothetical protein
VLTKKTIIVNFFSFYVGWWAILISNWKNAPIFGWIIFIIVMAIHFFRVSINKKKDALEIFLIALAGLILDTALAASGVLTFTNSYSAVFPPFWLIGIWILFATTISYSYQLIRNKISSQVIVGGFFAPVSYITGAKFGLLNLYPALPITFSTYYIIHGGCWLIFFPLCFYISKKVKGLS